MQMLKYGECHILLPFTEHDVTLSTFIVEKITTFG